MTRRNATIRRRATRENLESMVEIAAAGMLRCFFQMPGEDTRSYWHGVKLAHGDIITAKVLKHMPGCRPGFDYALGVYPPLPLVKEIPENNLRLRDHIDIDGDRHWFVGSPWQRCQAEHLREIGEVDGAEWIRYLKWKRSGFESTYRTEDDRLGRPVRIIRLFCW
jgi:hypothetical protein